MTTRKKIVSIPNATHHLAAVRYSRCYVGVFFAVLFFLLSGYGGAADNGNVPLIRKTIFGVFIHDRGPASDKHEGGFDPNWEIQFNGPDRKLWQWVGAPFPMVGLTPNFNGDTSVFYGGLTYEVGLSNRFLDDLTRNLTKRLFVAGSVSLALHDGPLHKDKLDCEHHSDCGFGYRVLPRLAGEIGINFWQNHGLSLFYDHMSHKGVLPGENEGIDHIGIRYHYRFSNSRLQSFSR